MQASLILALNTRMATSPFLTTLISILSDIFVFSYPLYLIYLYFFSHDAQLSRWQKLRHKTDDHQHKLNALTILASFIRVIIINYIIKFFYYEHRPFEILSLPHNPQEALILHKLPVNSFPSDHAAVGMTIAVTTLLLGYQQNNKNMITIWRILLVFALIMDVSRITIGVHRPLDILAWSVIGIVIAFIGTNTTILKRCSDKVYTPLIHFQEKIFWLLKL